jgi:putative FmdB family regulatory protein
MPVYDYLCPQCGGFAETRPLAEYADPRPCPGCGTIAPRALTIPNLGAGVRERASTSGSQPGGGTRHFSGCACCGGRSAFRAEPVSAG